MTNSPNLPTIEPAIDHAAKICCALMEEIKIRLGAIQTITDSLRADINQPLGFVQAEAAILQLRMVCEAACRRAQQFANKPGRKSGAVHIVPK